tara:strand:- start:321 stop:806 length:486 start_codon:yes stop_codon:yes gene_type:complete
MSKTTQEHIDELKESIVSATKNTISGFLSEATEQYKASLTEADDSEDESEDDKSEDDSKDDDSIEESDESEDDESEDDDSIEESDESEDDKSEDDKELSEGLKVTAVRHATPNKTEDIKINNIRELNKLAATGQYGWFGVEKRNGDYEEYTVDEKNKLVLM